MTVVHLYDATDGAYQGVRDVCGKPWPVWNEIAWAYETHYCGVWDGHENVGVFQHICPCGADDREGEHDL